VTCVGVPQDVEADAQAWDRHSFDAADVGSMYPMWRSIEQITEEGQAMTKRTVEIFTEAKNAKIMEDVKRFKGKIPDDKEDT
jgi:hypothetical protein